MRFEHAVRPDHINRERMQDVAMLQFAMDSSSSEENRRDIQEQIAFIEALRPHERLD